MFPLKNTLVVLTAAVLGLSLIRAPYPRDQMLQHVPTVAALVLLAVAARRSWLSTASLACIVALLGLHILGARYVYSFVPYDRWSSALFGSSISEWFGWQRNHYDRLVHFCFGALCMVPAIEIVTSRVKTGRAWAVTFALCAVMTIGALYEVFEWLLTVFMSPRDAEAYNGQQGDFWDAQKDMALALTGAAVLILLLVLRGPWRRIVGRRRAGSTIGGE